MIYETRPDLNVKQASILVYNVDSKLLEDTLHRNKEDEVVLITKGTGTFQIGSMVGDFGPGTIAYVRAGTLRYWSSGSEDQRPILVSAFVVRIPAKALGRQFLDLKEAEGLKSFLARVRDGAFVHSHAYQRIEARIRTILGSRGMIRIARTHALLDLLSRIGDWQVVESKEVKEKTGEDHARLKRVHQYLESRFQSPVKREDLARLVDMEPNSFSRFYRRASGQKLSDYLAVLRVRHAAMLLGSRQRMPVSKVARQSGFHNLSAFNRQFKKRLGVSPQDYRKQLNSEPVQP